MEAAGWIAVSFTGSYRGGNPRRSALHQGWCCPAAMQRYLSHFLPGIRPRQADYCRRWHPGSYLIQFRNGSLHRNFGIFCYVKIFLKSFKYFGKLFCRQGRRCSASEINRIYVWGFYIFRLTIIFNLPYHKDGVVIQYRVYCPPHAAKTANFFTIGYVDVNGFFPVLCIGFWKGFFQRPFEAESGDCTRARIVTTGPYRNCLQNTVFLRCR